MRCMSFTRLLPLDDWLIGIVVCVPPDHVGAAGAGVAPDDHGTEVKTANIFLRDVAATDGMVNGTLTAYVEDAAIG